MIGKIVKMDRNRRPPPDRRLERLQTSVFALTRYVVDADPHALAAIAAEDVLSITDYALAIRRAGIEPGEKVEAAGTRNLLGRDLAEWQAEMLATAAGATSVKNPMVHIILSLHEGESWSPNQRDEAITIVLETLGLAHCQTIWAEHSNTMNPHLHLAVLRVDPASGAAAGTDWLIDDLHQGLAIIEERQGRVREPHALYLAREGAVFDVETGALVRRIDGTFVAGWWKAQGKKRTWLPERIRNARSALVQACSDASSWADFHERLHELAAEYEKAGSGARIKMGEGSAKASEVHASLSRPELEKRLGPFERDQSRVNTGYEAYKVGVQDILDHLRQRRSAEVEAVNAWVEARKAELHPDNRTLLAPLVEREGAKALKVLEAAFASAIRQCTLQRKTADQWRQAGEPERPLSVSSPMLILPTHGTVERSGASCAGEAQEVREAFHTDFVDREGRALFSDHRAFILVHASSETAAIDEALTLAAQRWGTLRLTGPAAFVELARARAKALDIKTTDDGSAARPPRATSLGVRTNVSTEALPPSSVERPMTSPERIRAIQVQKALRTLDQLTDLAIRRRTLVSDTALGGRTGPFEIIAQHRDRRVEDVSILDADPLIQAYLGRRHQERIDAWMVKLDERCDGPLPYQDDEVIALLSPPGTDEHRLAQLACRDAEFRQMTKELRARLKDRRPKKPADLGRSEPPPLSEISAEDVRRVQQHLAQLAARGR